MINSRLTGSEEILTENLTDIYHRKKNNPGISIFMLKLKLDQIWKNIHPYSSAYGLTGIYFMELNVSLFNILMDITTAYWVNSFIFLEFTIILKYIITESSLTADI